MVSVVSIWATVTARRWAIAAVMVDRDVYDSAIMAAALAYVASSKEGAQAVS